MSMVTTTSSMSTSRASRVAFASRATTTKTARARMGKPARRTRAVVAAMDGGGGSGSLANEVRARACIFGSSIARGRGGDRVEAALARGVERGWRPARARARDGAWGNLMGSSYPSGCARRGDNGREGIRAGRGVVVMRDDANETTDARRSLSRAGIHRTRFRRVDARADDGHGENRATARRRRRGHARKVRFELATTGASGESETCRRWWGWKQRR